MNEFKKIIVLFIINKKVLFKLFFILFTLTTCFAINESYYYHSNASLFIKDTEQQNSNVSGLEGLIKFNNKSVEEEKIKAILKSERLKQRVVIRILENSGNINPSKKDKSDIRKKIRFNKLKYKYGKLEYINKDPYLAKQVLEEVINSLKEIIIELEMSGIKEMIQVIDYPNSKKNLWYYQLITRYLTLLILFPLYGLLCIVLKEVSLEIIDAYKRCVNDKGAEN